MATIPVEDDLRRIERQVHAFLAEERQHGEWFETVMDLPTLEALILRAIQCLMEQDQAHAARTVAAPGPPQFPRNFGSQVELGKRVARIREERRMSQQELAARAHLSYQTLWRIERGTQGKPSVFTAGAIARVLGVSMDYLVGMYEDDDSEQLTPAVA